MDTETRNVLREAKNLVVEEWGQGDGLLLGPKPGHCVSTAISNSKQDTYSQRKARHLIMEELGVELAGELFAWNDAPGRTQAEVVALFDRVLTNNSESSQANPPVTGRNDGLGSDVSDLVAV